MKLVFAPAIYLMQRLRLLPKFALVSFIFMVPLILVTALLIQELNKSIVFAQNERNGVSAIHQVQKLIYLSQMHRGLRHMALAGNTAAGDRASQIQSEIVRKIATVDGSAETTAVPGMRVAFAKIKQEWAELQSNLPVLKAKESYAAHSALIAQLYGLTAQIADRTNLTLDPQVETYYLIGTFVKSFPDIAEGLSEIAGRGAAYIDTGLMEPNEDVLLNSTVMLARRDLARIPAQLDAMYRENPVFKGQLAAQTGAIPAALDFLERAKTEVLSASNDAVGNQFFDAGRKAAEGLYGFADASAGLLDTALQHRIGLYQQRRNLMAAGVLVALLVAAYLLTGFYLSFSREVKELETAVGYVACGDLSTPISSIGKDEIAQLLNAFGGMSVGLAQLVSEVRSGTQNIAVASREMASGNADLSTRTEEQAGSLTQTASSMDQLALSVINNADSALQANRLALAASEVAVRGGEAVEQLVDTMGSIIASAKKINDIVGVIDGIAFQTNILALNAAVEAARAGEQGRGFAVVAGEVRNLAQRSATAAKEIKGLIAESMQTVDTGSRHVMQTGKTMNEIVSSVRLVTDIMREISASSSAQRSGIEQVNQAVGQMDAITQQNAALVEQAAAAAESMEQQALMLTHAVAVFRLADDTVHPGGNALSAPDMVDNVRLLPVRPVMPGMPPSLTVARVAA